MAEQRSFLERPLAVVALVGGVLGAVGTVVAIVTSLGAVAPDQPRDDLAQARVSACVSAHGLTEPSQTQQLDEGRWYFRACSWPAPAGAGADGFSEITVFTEAGPGTSEAEGLTVAHVLTSSCRDLEVAYLFESQGTFVPEQPVRLTKGEVRRVEGGSVVPDAVRPGRDQFVVLSSGRYQLGSARCV